MAIYNKDELNSAKDDGVSKYRLADNQVNNEKFGRYILDEIDILKRENPYLTNQQALENIEERINDLNLAQAIGVI